MHDFYCMSCRQQVTASVRAFAEKTFKDGSETAKNVNVFSLESFPLYGNTSEAGALHDIPPKNRFFR